MSNFFDTYVIGSWSGWRWLRLLLIAYGTLCSYGLWGSERQIFLPPPVSYSMSGVIKIPVQDSVQTAQNPETTAPESTAPESIAAIFYPNPESRFVVLYSHGNGEDLGSARPRLEEIRQAGFAVLAYDYRGYGHSDGQRPSERQTYADIEAAYRYLTQSRQIPPSQIIVYGRSVGGGPSVYLAATQPIAGLVIESSFVSIFRVVTRIPLLPFDRFPSLARIKQVTAPILVMHGTEDEVIPFWHGERLYAAARSPKQFLWVEGAGHNNLSEVAGDRYPQALQRFQQLLATAAPNELLAP